MCYNCQGDGKEKDEEYQAMKIIGWVLLAFGVLVFLYGLLITLWYISLIGGIIAGVGWATVLISRH